MLHKSFKSAKCKTALNLAKSRIKLMKNKKEMQVKLLKRELAQLLESGQDQTARIRVEHVVREEKTMAAYELIEIYCELIVARLPIIDSQKNCPLDLKEAITSLIFAAPRCGDIPELQDIRKHFTAKYGKEFVAAATELRPACGVGRMMVEKLSVNAPDGPTKVKILTAIAEEHNIKWEPKWFKDEDPMPSSDMQKVQRTEKASMIQMEPLNIEIADTAQQPNAHDVARSGTSFQSRARTDIDAYEVPPSATSHPTGSSSERMASSQSSRVAENTFSAGRQNWNMEFKDATEAAEAAAESAERASMAARAAAEFSTRSKIIGDASSGPVASSAHDRSEASRPYAGSVSEQKHVERNSTNSSFNQRGSRLQGDQRDVNEQGNMTESTEARILKEDYTKSGVQSNREDYRESENSSYPVDRDMRSQSKDSVSTQSTSEAATNVFDFSNHQEYGNEPVENPFYGETVEMKEPPSRSQSQSSAFGDVYGIFSNLNDRNKDDLEDGSSSSFNRGTANNDDWNVKSDYYSGFSDDKEDPSFKDQRGRVGSDKQKYAFDSGMDIFVSTDHRTDEMDVKEIYTHTSVHFDESGSDNDESIFDPVQKSYDLPTPGKSSANQFPFHEDSSPKNCDCQSSLSSHPHHGLDVSESFRKSPLYSKLSEPLSVTFDSDGASSGSEKELQIEKTDPVIHSNDYREPETNPFVSTAPQKSPQSLRRPLQSSDPVSEFQHESQSSPEGGMELNLGLLPGGRRNRSQWRPSYTRGASGDDSSSKSTNATVDDAFGAGHGTSPLPENTPVSRTTGFHTHFDSADDDAKVAIAQKGPNIAQTPYSATFDENVQKPRPKGTSTYYNPDDSSSEEDAPKQLVMSRKVPGAGLSKRTKASAPGPVTRSKPSVAKDYIKPTERPSRSDTTEVSSKLLTETTGFRSRNTESSRRDEEATSRPRPQTKVSKGDERFSSIVAEKPRSPPKGAEIPRASNSSEKAPSRENSIKTPRHVHPKLPDFESLTAHLQSLRTNRE